MTNLIPNNVIRVPCKKEEVFKYWLEFLAPFHHLTGLELKAAVQFLIERHELSKVILDIGILEKTLFSEDVQKKIREVCDITTPHFQVIKSKLKAKKFFIGNKVNPRLIPNIKEENGNFQLLLLFDYDTPASVPANNSGSSSGTESAK